jgi:hypothetical protein
LSARHFYQTRMEVWRESEPEMEETRSHLQAEVPSMEPLGFLGILHHNLGGAAGDVGRRSAPHKIRHGFAHKGQLMFLDLTDHQVDSRR